MQTAERTPANNQVFGGPPTFVEGVAIFGHGDAASEIVRIAETESADLKVIATHGMTGWRRVLFRSVAEKVVRPAKCPVLSLRAPQTDGN